MELASVVDELYGLGPDTFTATRDQRAKDARAERDRDLAKAIGALRKPSVAAWAVNVAARVEPDAIAAVLKLGAALQAAQSGGTNDLRELLASRQGVVATAVARIHAVARERGQAISESGAAEIEQTLRAAMADADVAALVRSGRLTSAVTTSVLGGFDVAAISAAPQLPPSEPAPVRLASVRPASVRPAAETPSQPAEPAPARQETSPAASVGGIASARRALESAEHAATLADRAVTEAKAEAERAGATASRLRVLVADLRTRLSDAETDLSGAEAESAQATRTLEAAELAAADARSDVDAAERELAGRKVPRDTSARAES